MPWVPESDPMVIVTEYQNFSVTIQYYELVGGGVDPETGFEVEGTPVYYNVNVTPQGYTPSTISITGNGTTSVTISGYYGASFNDNLTVMLDYDIETPTNNAAPVYKSYDTVNTPPVGVSVWEKVTQDPDVFEIISFIPDPTRTRDFGYTCTSNGSSVTKIGRVQDFSWDSGNINLGNAVNALKRRQS